MGLEVAGLDPAVRREQADMTFCSGPAGEFTGWKDHPQGLSSLAGCCPPPNPLLTASAHAATLLPF